MSLRSAPPGTSQEGQRRKRKGSSPMPMELEMEPEPKLELLQVDNQKEDKANSLSPATTTGSMVKVMNNSLIMSKIAKKLRADVLTPLRITCPIWNRIFLPEISEICNNKAIQRQMTKTKAVCLINNSAGRSMLDLVNFIRSSRGRGRGVRGRGYVFPFTSFRICLDKECQNLEPRISSSNRGRGTFLDFISTVGSNITKLDLSWNPSTGPSIAELRSVIFGSTPELVELILSPIGNSHYRKQPTQLVEVSPNQQKLSKLKKFKAVVTERLITMSAFNQLICDVVCCADTLEELELFDDPEENEFLSPVLAGIRDNTNANNNSNIQKLKSLAVSSLKEVDLAVLLQLAAHDSGSLKLGSFSCIVDRAANLRRTNPYLQCPRCRQFRVEEAGVGEMLGLLHDFLVTQESTLNQLALNFSKHKDTRVCPIDGSRHRLRVPSPPCVIPKMDHLKKLLISRCQLRTDEIRFKGNFQNAFPQLTTFTYNTERLPVAADVDRLSHPGVKNLELGTPTNGLMTFVMFENVFPSLTRLKLQLRPPTLGTELLTTVDVADFASIWTTWPRLTRIKIDIKVDKNKRPQLDLDLDSWLSGVPRESLEHLWNTCESKYGVTALWTLDSIDTLLKSGGYKISPGVSDLRHLQELEINLEGSVNRFAQLCDLGGYFGLALASSSLQRAVILGDGKNWVSEEFITFLRRIFGPATQISL